MTVASFVLVTGITVASAGVASATTAYPSVGGTWDYGASAQSVWSNYAHNSRVHKLSTDGAGGLKFSGWVGYGVRSFCNQGAKLFGNHA
ncbi:hypothetical protein Xcel_1598 [Xylanimonas cellulosilytica DSM 15894]|uniref:Lactococcin 972 family bacteriocin n=1 Tax=Xylanimonas cellulosilytica (strain DSM 15894 / JCM 12276 / CECT 5975 / KCTC 9989 / LMG 20990 / NBRC 107835 / XIL07) TaxID=446471 RepID=D1BSD2_XYLCX|nr:lactococcin 972 family bacteriocin [Xylanimonas cellulosilytica]ACZ30624.1 hypothetical protein Xcel_1598 [Xylanimonas cellulosilytica DSM 15894]